MKTYPFLFLIFSLLLSFTSAEQCGRQDGGALCPNGLCCSKWGYCGTTEDYCKLPDCQSNCWLDNTPPPPPPRPTPPPSPPGPTPGPAGDLSDIITRALFEKMLLHRNDDPNCAIGFYTYDAFITAAKSFPGFGNTGNTDLRKKEIAAFFGQTSHETTGGWPDAPDGPYAWGYCFKTEQSPTSDYCDPTNVMWPCAPGKTYIGRGPIQLSWNYNYGPCGKALGLALLNDPDLVASDAVIAFKTALWFWMTPQSPKPSCHDVITDQWQPSDADLAAGRLPGYGMITNIINGGIECGKGPNDYVEDRIGFYKRYCDILGISPGENLDCYNQRPFGTFFLDAAI